MNRFGLIIVLCFSQVAAACTLCDPGNLKLQTLRQEARSAKRVVLGTLANARLVGDRGYTDLIVDKVLKGDPLPKEQKTIVLDRWTPVDPKKPKQVLVFFDFYEGKWDPYRGVDLKSPAAGGYLLSALAIDEKDRDRQLLYYFDHLDQADTVVSADAFLEFAKADDAEIVRISKKLDRRKLRAMFDDPKTPSDRLGLFGYLLAACGTADDFKHLVTLTNSSDDRYRLSLGGILGGLIEARPQEGWDITYAMLHDPKRNIADRIAALGAVRFQQSARPVEYRKAILACMKAVVATGDMADMAIEDMRRWGWWDLSTDVFAAFDKPTHSSPLVKNAIVRYGLTCRNEESQKFIARIKQQQPDLVKDLEEALRFERPPAAKE